MGGARGGATASAIAVNLICPLAFNIAGDISSASLQEAIELTNQHIFNLSQVREGYTGMGTTVVALAISGDSAIVAHVGDSRIYRCSGGKLTPLTKDHSLIRELLDSGAISEKEAENHPVAHMLTRSLGPAEEVRVEVRVVEEPLKVGDKFLLCCDGLHNLVNDEEIQELLGNNSPKDAAEKLVELALSRGGNDNITVEIICIADKGAKNNFSIPPKGEIYASYSTEYDHLKKMKLPQEEGVGLNFSNGISFVYLDKQKETRREQDGAIYKKLLIPADIIVDEVEDAATDFDDQGRRPSSFDVSTEEILEKKTSTGLFIASLLVASVTIGLFYLVMRKPEVLVGNDYAVDSTSDARDELIADLSSWNPQSKPETNSQLAILSRSANSNGANSKDNENNQLREHQVINEVIGRALNISIGQPPLVLLDTQDVIPNEPIDWEEEEQRLGFVVSSNQEIESVSRRADSVSLITDEERQDMLAKKLELREGIADVDAKLGALAIRTKEIAQNRISALDVRLSIIDKAQSQLGAEINRAKQDIAAWTAQEESLKSEDSVRVARHLAQNDSMVKKYYDAFENSSIEYLESVENWRANQQDDKLSATMAARGREYRTRKIELEETLVKAVTQKQTEIRRRYADYRLKDFFLGVRRNRLNRHIGFLKALHPSGAQSKRISYEKLIEERSNLLNALLLYQEKVSDEEEIILRRKQYFEELTGKN
jgi:serine/threonine protein phosphatase PrpC/flagellin-like hook-associated protein FlgL